MAVIPSGARITSLAGLAQRLTQTARFVISGVRPDTWFGPFQPLAPMTPDQPGIKGRRWDYPTGINLNYVPRSSEAIGFAELRALADSCDLLRIAIESRKDQMASLEWVIRPREATASKSSSLWHKQGADAHPDLPQETKDRIKAITDFFQYPDKEVAWDQWVKSWMEDVFVIDAPSIWRRRNRDGTLYALEQIDGATIKPLVGPDGRRPRAPDPAYQQVLHGIPAADYTREELLYIPWNLRSNHLYGYSKVEQILITVNTSIRRSLFQLNYYTEGSQPDAFMGLPKEWDMSQIKDFQDYMDSLLSGNLATRRHLRFVPSPFDYKETKSPPLKDVFDEYLARLICFTFAIAPDPFIEHVSRGAVEKSHTRALEEGLEPNQRYVKTTMDLVISEDFRSPDLEFKYIENREQDPKQQADIDVAYAKAGIYSIDEVRVARGKPPLGGPAGIPMLATSTGYVPLSALTAPGVAASLAAAGGPAAQAISHQRGEGTDGSGSSGGSSNENDPQSEDETTVDAGATKALMLKYFNELASQGGSGGDWYPETTPDTNSSRLQPQSQVRRKGHPAEAGEVASENSMDPRQPAEVGRHPEPMSQSRLDYYHRYGKSKSRARPYPSSLSTEELHKASAVSALLTFRSG